MKKKYILDTNHLSEAIKRVSRVRERIAQIHRAGHGIETIIPVMCEIEVGIQCMRAPEPARRHLQWIMSRISIWPLTLETCSHYAEFFLSLRARGRTLSQVDLMIASLARQMNSTVLKTDRDFEAIPEVRTENWCML